MPKERVIGSQLPFADEDDPGIVEIRWGREDGHVQIVSRLHSAEVFVPEGTPGEEIGEEIPARYGFYIDLDRRGINDLIRKLRRARDQAMGRDE